MTDTNAQEKDMTNTIERINPPEIFDSTKAGYSQGTVVEAGRLAFFSGQVAWTPDSSTAPSSLSEVTAPIRPNPTNYAAAAWRPGGDLSSLARQPRRPCSPLVNMPSWRSKTRTRSRC